MFLNVFINYFNKKETLYFLNNDYYNLHADLHFNIFQSTDQQAYLCKEIQDIIFRDYFQSTTGN